MKDEDEWKRGMAKLFLFSLLGLSLRMMNGERARTKDERGKRLGAKDETRDDG